MTVDLPNHVVSELWTEKEIRTGRITRMAVLRLYSIAYNIKDEQDGNIQTAGYFDYVVPPLEGLWWTPGPFELFEREDWLWTSMIRQPEFVTPQTIEWAKEQSAKKKPELDVSKVSLIEFEEGLCVQMLHLGPYLTEPETLAVMHRYMESRT
jgi:hypothetical protein